MNQLTLASFINDKRFKKKSQLQKHSKRFTKQFDNQMKYKVKSEHTYKFKEEKKDESYKKITFFHDRNGDAISESLVFAKTKTVWSQPWIKYTPRDDINEMIHEQIERRVNREGEADFRRNVRAEPLSNANIKKRLVKGLTGECFVYEELSKLQYHETDIGKPRDDGASWFADIFTFSGDFIECKTTQGDYIPGQYRRLLKETNDRKKQREYYRNSPSYCLNIADKYGNKKSKSHACKAARGESHPNEFFCGIRNRMKKGKRQMKISFIIRMIDLERKFEVDGKLKRVFDMVVVPWDDNRSKYKGFVKGKGRLIEDLLIETFTKYNIPFYKPMDNRFKSNGLIVSDEVSPKTIMVEFENVDEVQTLKTGQFDLLD